MLFINIDESIKCNNVIYNVIYLDYPNFSFAKRITKRVVDENRIYEYGIDFSFDLYYYECTYNKDNELISNNVINDLDKCKSLLLEFDSNNIVDKIIKKEKDETKSKLIERLFEEVKLKCL